MKEYAEKHPIITNDDLEEIIETFENIKPETLKHQVSRDIMSRYLELCYTLRDSRTNCKKLIKKNRKLDHILDKYIVKYGEEVFKQFEEEEDLEYNNIREEFNRLKEEKSKKSIWTIIKNKIIDSKMKFCK